MLAGLVYNTVMNSAGRVQYIRRIIIGEKFPPCHFVCAISHGIEPRPQADMPVSNSLSYGMAFLAINLTK
jgi:hypothetical protein